MQSYSGRRVYAQVHFIIIWSFLPTIVCELCGFSDTFYTVSVFCLWDFYTIQNMKAKGNLTFIITLCTTLEISLGLMFFISSLSSPGVSV